MARPRWMWAGLNGDASFTYTVTDATGQVVAQSGGTEADADPISGVRVRTTQTTSVESDRQGRGRQGLQGHGNRPPDRYVAGGRRFRFRPRPRPRVIPGKPTAATPTPPECLGPRARWARPVWPSSAWWCWPRLWSPPAWRFGRSSPPLWFCRKALMVSDCPS